MLCTLWICLLTWTLLLYFNLTTLLCTLLILVLDWSICYVPYESFELTASGCLIRLCCFKWPASLYVFWQMVHWKLRICICTHRMWRTRLSRREYVLWQTGQHTSITLPWKTEGRHQWVSSRIPRGCSRCISLQWCHKRAMASQITGNSTACLSVCTSNNKGIIKTLHYWPFLREIHQWPVDCPHKRPVMWKAFPCHAIIMSKFATI